MRRSNLFDLATLALLAIALLGGAGCTSNDLDDAGGPDVYLQLDPAVSNPPITAADNGGGCVFTVTDWTIPLINVPLTPLATTSPYNDVELHTAAFTYTGFPVAIPSVSRPISATVPANLGTATIPLAPVTSTELALLSEGDSGNVTITLSGTTGSSDAIQETVSALLTVNVCIVAGP